jgi:hypothetical protein
MRREERRLREGRPYEPPTFYEVNAAAVEHEPLPAAEPCRWVAMEPTPV